MLYAHYGSATGIKVCGPQVLVLQLLKCKIALIMLCVFLCGENIYYSSFLMISSTVTPSASALKLVSTR